MITTADVNSVVDATRRGVSVIASVHGSSLECVVTNPTTCGLVGGSQAVILAMQERCERNALRKTCTERISPPAFDIVVELHSLERWSAFEQVARAVDTIHLGQSYLKYAHFM
ncbi:hypothetical protein DIPPA_27718 [Diplonema papillatum]|nr:hypothetical protein DIPPA_27718 [Diplonema papillatum]